MTTTPRILRDHLEAAAKARRRGDFAAAEAAETQALLVLRTILLRTGQAPASAAEQVPA
jgi:hypothetical protein